MCGRMALGTLWWWTCMKGGIVVRGLFWLCIDYLRAVTLRGILLYMWRNRYFAAGIPAGSGDRIAVAKSWRATKGAALKRFRPEFEIGDGSMRPDGERVGYRVRMWRTSGVDTGSSRRRRRFAFMKRVRSTRRGRSDIPRGWQYLQV